MADLGERPEGPEPPIILGKKREILNRRKKMSQQDKQNKSKILSGSSSFDIV